MPKSVLCGREKRARTATVVRFADSLCATPCHARGVASGGLRVPAREYARRYAGKFDPRKSHAFDSTARGAPPSSVLRGGGSRGAPCPAHPDVATTRPRTWRLAPPPACPLCSHFFLFLNLRQAKPVARHPRPRARSGHLFGATDGPTRLLVGARQTLSGPRTPPRFTLHGRRTWSRRRGRAPSRRANRSAAGGPARRHRDGATTCRWPGRGGRAHPVAPRF